MSDVFYPMPTTELPHNNTARPGHDIIVVGASAGGVEALGELVSLLPADLPAAVFIVLHIPAYGTSVLPGILSRRGPLPAVHPADGEAIRQGRIYVAPPDHHLLLEKDGTVRLTRGPHENGHRPAVDTLFRSAARAYGPRVIGVVLTGTLDDGTAGLQVVKRRGGLAVVQDPEEALFASMPRAAIEAVAVDHVAALAEIGSTLARLAHLPAPAESEAPVTPDLEDEVKVAEFDIKNLETRREGKPSSTPARTATASCGRWRRTTCCASAAGSAMPSRPRASSPRSRTPWRTPCGPPCAPWKRARPWPSA